MYNYEFIKKFLLINGLILFIFSFFIVPTNDTYYYWTWSKKLQLSYFDGPPMIAYLIWLSTHLFGDNFFALGLISTISIYGSSFLLYKTVRIFADKNTALLTISIWIVFPFSTTRFIATSMTLDGLEAFFSFLILYSILKWIKTRHIKWIYFLGVATGSGLLAKYNVIILIASLMLYLLFNKDLRRIYLSPHLYIAMMIAIFIFSPVLIWNYQNQFISFKYQLTSHNWNGPEGAINSFKKHGINGVLFYLCSCVFGVLNILLLIVGYMKYIKKISIPNNLENKAIIWSIYFILGFWLYISYSAHVGLNYMLTTSGLISIIVSQQLVQAKHYCFTKTILLLFGIISLIMLIDKSKLHPKDIYNYNKYFKT